MRALSIFTVCVPPCCTQKHVAISYSQRAPAQSATHALRPSYDTAREALSPAYARRDTWDTRAQRRLLARAHTRAHRHRATCSHSHAVTLMHMQPLIARAQPDASPHARATAAKRRPRQKRVLESRLCRTPLQLLRVRAKIAPSEHAQAAGRQRVRTGEQQRACSGWVRAPSVAPVRSTNLRR